MKKILQSIFDFLLFSNIFMSLCAVAQGLVTFALIGSKPVYSVLALLFVATLGVYNFSILISKPQKPLNSPYKRERWFFAHYRLMETLTIVSLLCLLPLFFLISTESRILMIFLSVLSFAYGLPLFSLGDKKFGLRNIPGLKQFLITLVWTMSTVLLPLLEAQHMHLSTISMRDTTLLIAKRFLFIGALISATCFRTSNQGLRPYPWFGAKKRLISFARYYWHAISCCFFFSGTTASTTISGRWP
jgi:hypothetical protein